MSLILVLFSVCLFIFTCWKKEWQRVRARSSKRKREIFHPLIHYLISCNSQGLARLKPGARNFICVSHICGMGQAFEPLSVASKLHEQEGGLEVKWLGLRPEFASQQSVSYCACFCCEFLYAICICKACFSHRIRHGVILFAIP